MSSSIKIGTWNIDEGYVYEDMENFELAENFEFYKKRIDKINCDILCLQEVGTDKNSFDKNQAAQLLGSEWARQHFYAFTLPANLDKTKYLTGNAILLKDTEFVKTENVLLPNHDLSSERFPREGYENGLCVGTVKINEKQIKVISIHLHPLRLYDREGYEEELQDYRLALEEKLIEQINKEIPTLFIGDFNRGDLKKFFPKLFSEHDFETTIDEVTIPKHNKKADNFLYQKSHFTPTSVKVHNDTSTSHYLCEIEFTILDK